LHHTSNSKPRRFGNIFKDAYDMRIILTHEYFRVDVAVVWDTIKNDFPGLEALLGSVAPV
jgi:uncharacterized protein with HEPN domain